MSKPHRDATASELQPLVPHGVQRKVFIVLRTLPTVSSLSIYQTSAERGAVYSSLSPEEDVCMLVQEPLL